MLFEPPFQEACARLRCSSMAASKPAASKLNARIAARIFDEVARQTKCVVELEMPFRPDTRRVLPSP